jgi:hypothetical protein
MGIFLMKDDMLVKGAGREVAVDFGDGDFVLPEGNSYYLLMDKSE